MYVNLYTYPIVLICRHSNGNVHTNVNCHLNILTNRFRSREGGVEPTFVTKKWKKICKCNRHWTCIYVDLQTYSVVVICRNSNPNVHNNMALHLNILINRYANGKGGGSHTC